MAAGQYTEELTIYLRSTKNNLMNGNISMLLEDLASADVSKKQVDQSMTDYHRPDQRHASESTVLGNTA